MMINNASKSQTSEMKREGHSRNEENTYFVDEETEHLIL
jgi:hypothetical protein